MNDPQSWANGSDILAEPGIDPQNFRVEVPEYLRQVGAGAAKVAGNLAAMAEYFAQAGFDPSGKTMQRLTNALDAAQSVHESMAQAGQAATEFVNELPELPDFSKV